MADKDFVVKNGLVVNNSFYANVSGIYIGNSVANSYINATSFSGTANNSSYLGGTLASAYQLNSTLSANVATLAANSASYIGTISAANVVTNAQLQANLSNYPSTTSNTTIQGTYTFNANIILSNTTAFIISSQGNSAGSPGQALLSNGSAVYWASVNSSVVGASGTNTYVQFNDNGSLGGNAGFTYNKATNTVTIANTLSAVGNALIGPGGNSNTVYINSTSISIGNTSVNATITVSAFPGTAANATLLNSQNGAYYLNYTNMNAGAVGAAYLPQATATTNGAVLFLDSTSNSAVTIYAPTMNAVAQTFSRATSAQSAAIAAYSNAVTYASNATNITNGTLPYAQLGVNVVNTSAAFTITGVHTHNANVIMNSNIVMNTAALIVTSGGFGTNGQALLSNGTSMYWGNVVTSGGGGATGNTAAGDAVFYVGGQTVNGDFTTNGSLNYMSAGPITVNANVTITTGSRWVIV